MRKKSFRKNKIRKYNKNEERLSAEVVITPKKELWERGEGGGLLKKLKRHCWEKNQIRQHFSASRQQNPGIFTFLIIMWALEVKPFWGTAFQNFGLFNSKNSSKGCSRNDLSIPVLGHKLKIFQKVGLYKCWKAKNRMLWVVQAGLNWV